jgi:hypothetical protein
MGRTFINFGLISLVFFHDITLLKSLALVAISATKARLSSVWKGF